MTIDRDKIFWKELEGEMVILNGDTGEYFTLNNVGAIIWEQIIQNAKDQEIISAIVAKFQIDEETASNDYNELKQTLIDKKIIT